MNAKNLFVKRAIKKLRVDKIIFLLSIFFVRQFYWPSHTKKKYLYSEVEIDSEWIIGVGIFKKFSILGKLMQNNRVVKLRI